MKSPVRLGVSPAAASTPWVFSISGLRLCFPEPGWWSASRSSCFFYAQMWGMGSASDHATTPFVQQSARFCVQPGNRSPVYPSCPSPPLLPVWMNVSFISLVVQLPRSLIFCQFWLFLFLNCCCPSLGCARRHSVSTYSSILARSPYKVVSFTLKIRSLG